MLIQDLNHIETVQDNIRGGLIVASDASVIQAGYGLYGSSYTSSNFSYDYYYQSAYTNGSASGSAYYGAQAVSSSSLIVY